MGLRADLGFSVMGYAKLVASNASTLNNQISSQACKNFLFMYPSPIWISSKPRIHGIRLTMAGMFSYQLVHVSSKEAGSGEVSSLRWRRECEQRISRCRGARHSWTDRRLPAPEPPVMLLCMTWLLV
ncbi:uncharacterized protein LOC101779129 isoform X2 [Setaria italica]|uniref:uncharacterized protein LOC101779129 isoform X2 n=1 Tax=Setaria italica TaxID=4555 RepID=UPI000BE5109D|nr:uncharacterized protein LOC101779129 isoform X2 [Setaria italica]